MVQVNVFFGRGDHEGQDRFEDAINDWLKENSTVKVNQIALASCASGAEGTPQVYLAVLYETP
jgi:hypothetical protein